MGADLTTIGQAEHVVVAASMIVPDFWETVVRPPDPDSFDDENLGALWTAILAVQRREPVTRFAVSAELREMRWPEAPAWAALRSARIDLITLPEAVAAAEVLHDRKLRRLAMQVCRETLKELETARDVPQVVLRHEVRIADVSSQSDGVDEYVRGEQVSEERLERVETGIRSIDEVSGGLPSGVLTLAAARTGMGKTALAVTLLRNVAKRGLGASVDSMEMPSMDLIHRASAAEVYDPHFGGGINYSDYEKRHLTNAALERFETAKAAIRRLPIWFNDKQGRTITQIRLGGRRVRTQAGRQGVDLRLIVVDHLGKIYPDRDRDSRNLELGDISNGLMEMASELRLPVVALAQLNRAVEHRPDKRPLISDLRESGRLEEDAHTILMLYRQAYYDDQARERGEEIDEDKASQEANILECNFVKNRGGPLRRVRLFCDIGANAILDHSYATAHLRRAQQAEMFS